MDKVKIIRVPVDELAYVDEIDATLESYQQLVGGYIEIIYPFDGYEVALVLNEEGKLKGLPVNRYLMQDGIPYDIIVGDAFVIGAHDDEEDFTSLTDEEADAVMMLIKSNVILNAK